MASLLLGAVISILSKSSNAAPSHVHRSCIDLDLSVPVTANNSIYDVPRVDNNIDAVDLIWDLDRWTAPATADRITAMKTVQQTFTISVQLCVPDDYDDSEKANILQIATHGFGFDKRYWDSELRPEDYSYVTAALKAGYSILTYDRLGVGNSDKPDAYEIAQTPVEREILKELTVLARSGGLTAAAASSTRSNKTFEVPDFNKIVLVGHSLGSRLTLGVLSEYGDIVDGAVATGLILNGRFGAVGQRAFGLEYAGDSEPRRFRERGSGYLVQGTESSVQQIFFKKGYFDPEMLKYAEKIKETGTVGEFVSLDAVLEQPAPGYSGPLLFALGEYDFAVCEGNCTGSYDLEALKNETFFNAADVRVHIQPGSGHALTMHSNATGHFEAIFEYLGENGL
ncbi:Alpha/beta hydrolase family-domain-containing protein [Aspergillus cavernicola]|uniref:Alpha/beta hydrolase family-domain-containing protein n=1 Tax=Aspergillus cavernicola TaxID=176166 RepID=A0ABR4ICJ7_9EURO